jgi:DNA processing protein
VSPCHACLRRMWLLERMAPNLERQRANIDTLMGLEDRELITLLGGAQERHLAQEHADFSPADGAAMQARAAAIGLELVCWHAAAYPEQLRALERAAPRVLAVNAGQGLAATPDRRPLGEAGASPTVNPAERLADLCATDAVAIVGTRRATRYGLAAAQRMGRDLAAAGLTVVSGMAFGIDSAAHEGALEAGGRTLAVFAGPSHRSYPARKSVLFRRILLNGCVISELGAEASTWRWALQARNRVIAGLAAATVLIEAPTRSGAMITVGHANQLGRAIGVLPGPVGVSQSAGPNRLLATGRAGPRLIGWGHVRAVRDAQDVLDLIYGEGIVDAPPAPKPALTPSEATLLKKLATEVANVTMLEPGAFADLAALELKGRVLRGAGGAITVLAN